MTAPTLPVWETVTLDLAPIPAHGGEVILVRHGQTDANAQDIYQGRLEYPLNATGRDQAARTGQRLATLGGISAVYCSPQARALETAQAIATACRLTPISDPDLQEIDTGALSGLTMAQLRERFPAEVGAYDAAHGAAPHARNRELLPGWEPVAAIITRTWRGVMAAAAGHPGQRIVVVAHGGVLNGFLSHLLHGNATESAWHYSWPNCGYTHLRFADPVAVVTLLETDHLPTA